jgi:hypothetical protein
MWGSDYDLKSYRREFEHQAAMLFCSFAASDEFVRRNQVLGDLPCLWNERRFRVEHDDPAKLCFESHEIEEQSMRG